MSSKVELTCPRCRHVWEASLDGMERMQEIYRRSGDDKGGRVVKYRTQCPNDGTYVIIEVQEA